MAKYKQRIVARRLRKEGKSIKEIAKKVGVSVGSVSTWCHDIELSKEQIINLEKRARDPFYGRRLSYSLAQKRKKELKIKRLHEEGKKEIGKLNKRELFLTGVALYWAEGFKKNSQAGLASMDPGMIRFFIKWLRECFDYRIEDLSLRVTVNISHKKRINEIEAYWAKVTKTPVEKFQKPFFQKVIWKKVYENPNEYYGVLRIKVRRSTDFLRKICGYIDGLRSWA